MNDKDRELIERVLKSAGEAGSMGWEHLVRYYFVSGVLSAIGYSLLVAGALYALRTLHNWKIKKDWDDMEKHLVRGIGMTVCVVAAAIFFTEAVSGLRTAMVPEGAAIRAALN